MTKTHYFLAIPIPQDIKHIYKDWHERVKEKLPFKSWVHHEDYHITLSFLGDAPLSCIQQVKTEMNRVCSMYKPFSLEVRGLGFFGKPESPRIFWAGVKKQEILENLQLRVREVCQQIGLELENRSYSPHITLARKWNSDEVFPVTELSHMLQPKRESTLFIVKDIVLYRTHLDKLPKYEPIATFTLHEREE